MNAGLKEKQFIIPMAGGGRIALYRMAPRKPVGTPLILAHGTISNADAVRPLGRYLAGAGYDCWLLEWGGHGESRASGSGQNFEYPAFNDLPAALDTACEQSGFRRVYWVSHSGGGHLPLMFLARNPECRDRIAGIVTLGTQATDAASGFRYRTRALCLKWITNLLGYTPGPLVRVGTEGEPTRLLAQWAEWNLDGTWKGGDGFDYMAGLSGVRVPVLMVAGAGDDIAPVSGCEKVYTALGSADKSFVACSVANGFSRDYTHGRLIYGRGATGEIYPKIKAWLEKRNA